MYGFENKSSNQTLSEQISPRLSRCTFASVNNLFPDANTFMVLALQRSCDSLVTKCAVHIFSSKSIMRAHSGEDQRNFIQLLEIPSQFMGNMSFTFVPSAPDPWVCLSKYWFAPSTDTWGLPVQFPTRLCW